MWEKEIAVANRASKSAGEVIMTFFGHLSKISKKGDINLVTDADIRAEKLVLEIISRHFPKDGILSEEAGLWREGSERIWIVDPLDGTTNFAHGFPFFAVSLSLQVDEEIVLGIVYNPYMDEHFLAVKDEGAFLNNSPINVSVTKEVGESLLATGFPYDVREKSSEVVRHFTNMLIRSQGIRRPGSAAIDLCYVASGRLDGFWEQGLKPWDTAAGALIVREAGGKVTTYEGGPYSPFSKNIVATNRHIHGEVISILNTTD